MPALAGATYFKRPNQVVPKGTGHPLQLGPGQEISIPLSGTADAIQAKKGKISFSNLTQCSILVDHAYFEDQGLKWGRGGFGYALPDSTSPLGWRRQPATYFPGDLNQTTGNE